MNDIGRFRALDAWRGIFALIVAVYHIPTLSNFISHLSCIRLLHSAYLMVDAFFVLSGFVMVHSYGEKINHVADIKKFLIRRLARLWPLHFFILLCFFAMEIAKYFLISSGSQSHNEAFVGDFSMIAFLANIALIHALGIFNQTTWNGPSWSISVEFYAYIVFAFIAYFFRKKIFSYISVLMILSSFILLIIITPKTIDVTSDFGFIRCIMGFFSGIVAYKVYVSISKYDWYYLWTSRLQELAIIFILFYMWFVDGGELGLYAPIVFSMFVIVYANDNARLSRIMLCGPMKKLGDISYSIYMIHYLILILIIRLMGLIKIRYGYDPLLGNILATDFLVLIYIIIIIFTAGFTHKYIELPAQKFIKKVLS